VNDLYALLSGIKDKATAQTALSGLDKALSEFDRLSRVVGHVPPDARKRLADTITLIRPKGAFSVEIGQEQLSQFVYALRFVLYDQEPLKEKRERKQSESQRLCASTIRHSKGSKKG